MSYATALARAWTTLLCETGSASVGLPSEDQSLAILTESAARVGILGVRLDVVVLDVFAVQATTLERGAEDILDSRGSLDWRRLSTGQRALHAQHAAAIDSTGGVADSRPDLFRVAVVNSSGPHVLMPNFSIVVPNVLAVSSRPRCRADIEAVRSLGVGSVISLTEEPLRESFFTLTEVRSVPLPVPDFCVPSEEQVHAFLVESLAIASQKRIALVHCAAGLGRSGTFAAIFLACFGVGNGWQPLCRHCTASYDIQDERASLKLGGCQVNPCGLNATELALDPEEAISLLRKMRPGSVETHGQQSFVLKFCSDVFER